MLTDAKNFFLDAQHAREKKIPILVMFSAPSCPYCELVKREVLNSMSELAEYKNKVIIRHVFYSSTNEVKDFMGETSNQAQFSSKHAANFYPTLLLFDDDGTVLDKKIGVTLIDTYWTELDTLIEHSTKQLKQQLRAAL